MNIVLLNPYFLPKYSRFSRSPAVTKSGTIYYPIWHAYATGVLEKAGYTVKLIDVPAANLSEKECYEIICKFKPKMVVVYTSTPSIYNDVRIAGNIKDSLPDSYIILTGPHVSALPQETLAIDSRVDAVASHEYDMTLVEAAAALENNRKPDDIFGLTVRINNNEIKTNPDRGFIQDLDSIPFISSVYKKHLKIENYFYAHCRYPIISIFTGRGCSARCNYCVYPEQMFGRLYRQRSPENIVEEFEYIEKEFPQAKEVLIDDDTFSLNQDHTIRFCELMIKKKIKIPWTVECRANLNYETMVAMKKGGCRLIVVGFESANDEILKNIKKGINFERMNRFVLDSKKAKIMVHACFMAGNQGETKETLVESLKFAKTIKADTCQFFPLMVYPGTKSYDWAKTNNYLITEDYRQWLDSEGLHNCVVNTPQLTAKELVNFCNYARKSYYLSPWYIFYKLKQSLTSFEEMKKTFKSAKVFLKYLFRN